jgi:hypothetical protein
MRSGQARRAGADPELAAVRLDLMRQSTFY